MPATDAVGSMYPKRGHMSKYRVLALDGGGIRSILTTILLQRLCKEPGLEHVFDGVDLIAGNSSGALIALAMAHGLFQPTAADTLARIREIFERGAEVFGPPNPFGFWLWPKYGVAARERGLKMLLGERTKLRELQRHVLIPTFDLDNQGRSDEGEATPRRWKPKIFHNFGPGNSDCERLAWEVGLSHRPPRRISRQLAGTLMAEFTRTIRACALSRRSSTSATRQIQSRGSMKCCCCRLAPVRT